MQAKASHLQTLCLVMLTFWHIGLWPMRSEALPVQACINLGNALDAPHEGDWGPPITMTDLDWIAAQGFDTVRLPVRFSAHWDGSIDAPFLARVDSVIADARERGLRVILDLHHFDALMRDPASQAPVFLAIWTELARHYAGHDEGLLFELLNEPRDALSNETLHTLYRAALPLIRAQNPDRWIILGGGNSNDPAGLAALPVFDARIALSFHYYEPYPFTHQQADWIETWFPPSVWGTPAEIAAVHARFATLPEVNAPIIMGEFGVTERADPASRALWTRTVRQAAEAHGIAWCLWAYRAGFGIVTSDGQGWQAGMQDALFGT